MSAAVTGLTANTTYHFRISATNASGTSKGSDETFKTLANAPTVVTKAASAVTQTTATLNATVNPNGGTSATANSNTANTLVYGFERCVLRAARVRDEPGRGVRGAEAFSLKRTPPTTSGSPRRTRAARAKARTKRSKRCPNPRRW